ncbi:MAG: SCO family protein [Acidobacteriota bacterium]|jgi:protein SCO1/2|nr:SCO family protein [Acidobacteriota bacterium]
MMKQRFGVVSVVLLLGFLASCQRVPEKRYEMKGKVVSVDKEQRQATIDHEEIKGFMDAMTMPFNIKEDWALSALAPGQIVEATLVVQGERSWIEGIRISQREASDGTETAGTLPKTGDEVPDFQLLNQDGRPIRLGRYRGRPLLLTFIYTRCPLPDFCPLTSLKFSEVYKGLKSASLEGPKPHLLTVSFDPAHDTPAVLRDYAQRFMRPADFDLWEFATGSEDDIRKITGYFGLTYRPDSGHISHNLITALIGPDGKLRRLYQGNRWAPAQVLAELK